MWLCSEYGQTCLVKNGETLGTFSGLQMQACTEASFESTSNSSSMFWRISRSESRYTAWSNWTSCQTRSLVHTSAKFGFR